MSIHPPHLRPFRWLLTLAAALALAPGCTGDPKPEYELVSFRNSRGLISYEYMLKKPPAVKPPTPTSSSRLDVLLRQQWAMAEARNQRRLDALAKQDVRRQRDEERRREQRELDAYQAARHQMLHDQRQQEQERYRAYQEQLIQWSRNQRLRAQAEVGQWQQVAQAIDVSLQGQR
jgi:hypothetical protein